jgi:hypothetical protein
VRFEVLTAVSMNMVVFWVVASCSLVKCTDVSEMLAASNIRSVSTLLPDCNTTTKKTGTLNEKVLYNRFNAR